ncbi:MAG: cation diffusion facilitator family transporter [Blastocatellia bacterium]
MQVQVAREYNCEHPQYHVPITLAAIHVKCAGGEHHRSEHHIRPNGDPTAATVSVRRRQYRALLTSFILSIVMMLVELVASWIGGSLLLLSDAIHMLSHVVALGIGLLAVRIAARPCGAHLPFGLYRVEVLGALVNGASLALLSLWIIFEAVERILNPVVISSGELIAVASLGLVVNVVSAFLLSRAGAEDLNSNGVWYHLVADAISSVIVLIGAILYSFSGWVIVDSALSILVSLIVGKWSLGLLKDATAIMLERKPDHIDLALLDSTLCRAFPEIQHIHDLHVWEITTNYVCFSAHFVLDDMLISETHSLRMAIADRLRHDFGIGHSVLQFESRGPSG